MLLLPALLLLLLKAAQSLAQEPCVDELGVSHDNNTNYYDYPDEEKRCKIYRCVDDREVLLMDRCRGRSARLAKLTLATGGTCKSHNGRRYRDGQTWWETTQKPCHQFICSGGRKSLKFSVTCPPIPAQCSRQDVLGQCCPKQGSCATAAPATCQSSSGRLYSEGQFWWETPPQPCRRFTCRLGRKELVQTVSCPAPNPLCQTVNTYGQCCPTLTQCGCLEHELTPPRQRRNGEQWTSASDPCMTRRCQEVQITDQSRLAQRELCPPPANSNCRLVPPPPGVCACPTYQCDSTGRPCLFNGVFRPHGSEWQIDPCTVGTCRDGAVHRATVDCPAPVPGCVPVFQPGVCCPQCSVPEPQKPCVFEGTTYQHNQTWGDDCGAHVCDNGHVISQYHKCPPPPKPACAPIAQAGSCCVRWSCQGATYGGHCTTPGESPINMLCYRPGPLEGACTDTGLRVSEGCCPIFECAQGCRDDSGTLRPHGSTWERGCRIFSCTDGNVSSVVRDCAAPVNEHCRRVNPTECCPRYDCDCNVDGQRRSDGEHWTADCHEHWCKFGRVDSRQVSCPEPPGPDCTPAEAAPGQCCPEYSCSCAAVSCPRPPSDPSCLPVGRSDDGCCSLYNCTGDCLDEQRRVHSDGSEWYVQCSKYRCLGGEISPVFEPCPPPPSQDCTARYLQPKDCCPVYDCPEPACPPGEVTFDGCNHCNCLPPGLFVCTLRSCEESGCSHSTAYYPHGANWTDPAQPCINFSCRYGSILTSVTQCPPAPGPLCVETPVPGECCPRWDCAASPCPANFTDVTWEDDCNTCTCNSAGVVCTEHTCPKQCLASGTMYETGDTIMGEGRCDKHICLDGVAVSVLEECKEPPNFYCSEPSLDSGDCCPVWQCQAVPGMGSPCKLGSIYQAERDCLFCQCVPNPVGGATIPVVLCSKMDCTAASCWDEEGEHEHGSMWATVNPCKHRACASGRIREMEVRCQQPPADYCRPMRDDSRCCPIYDCSTSCHDGDTWTHDCNSCVCRAGRPVCTTRGCGECTEGETWHVDCNNCTCILGKPVCTEKACGDGSCVQGDVWYVECNTCICLGGVAACTRKLCDNQAPGCPTVVGALVAPERHPSGPCHTNSQCLVASGVSVANAGCCGGRCVALSGKPGTCPERERAAGCLLPPAFTCSDDHQCPGLHKCCEIGGCRACVAPDGAVLSP